MGPASGGEADQLPLGKHLEADPSSAGPGADDPPGLAAGIDIRCSGLPGARVFSSFCHRWTGDPIKWPSWVGCVHCGHSALGIPRHGSP